MQTQTVQKGNRSFSVRKTATLAMLAAISIVLVFFIHFPLFPAAAFLEYDPADIPILIGTFAFGPVAGLLLTLVVSVIQGVTVSAGSGIIGIVMHFLATGIFTLVAGNIYRLRKTRGGAALALLVGVLVWTGAMVLCNLIFTPIFMETPMDVVLEMMIPVILPFNLIKAGINAVITFLIYKPLSKYLHRLGEI